MSRRKPNDEKPPTTSIKVAARSVRDPRRREPREEKRKAQKAHVHAPATRPRTVRHPKFGAIPLVQRTGIDANGQAFEFSDYDPDYAPPLPRGAVRGDVRRQEFCRMCHRPRYFYVDEAKKCVQCGEAFVFGASEQKHWYETLKFHFDSVAVRCPTCRKQRRSVRALETQLAAARAAASTEPRSPTSLLALAEAIARLFERTGQGKLSDGIAASRAARREAKSSHHAEAAASLFWEATCQRLAGHEARARALYDEFLATTPSGRNHKALAEEARRWLLREG